jgi:hypothetical protein
VKLENGRRAHSLIAVYSNLTTTHHHLSPAQFQTVKVDSVVTAELNTGKDEAKQRRKSVNARCEALRERQAGLMGKMQTIIKRSA